MLRGGGEAGRWWTDALEARQAREASELVAQSVGVLVLAAHAVEAGATGGGEVDEHIGKGSRADRFAGEYDKALVSERFSRDEANRAARARWGERWQQKLEDAR